LIKCLATEESQAGNTFENAAFIAGEWGPDAHPEVFGGVSGVRRYQSATALYLPDGGEIRASTAGSASKDGGKETFVVVDESHLYVLRELKSMYATLMRNLGKRKLADPWGMQTTTMYRLGELSVAEDKLTMWRKGELDGSVLVDHREAKGAVRIKDKAHTIAQLRTLYGPAMHPKSGWMDPERVYADMLDPTICPDEATAARYYLNRAIAGADAWIATDVVERQRRVEVVAPGTAIALGFDGSLRDDATVLIGSRMSDGFLFPVGIWAKPAGPEGSFWEVPRADVLAAVREAFGLYEVSRMYADPHEWRTDIDSMAGELGEERVLRWETRRDVQMAAALDRLHAGLMTGEQWHSGDPVFMEHFGNAYVRRKGGHRLVRKEHDQSPRKIDSVVGAALAVEARADALAAGWGQRRTRRAYGF
jgi:phage terminase large subunit-like protein